VTCPERTCAPLRGDRGIGADSGEAIAVQAPTSASEAAPALASDPRLDTRSGYPRRGVV
jgi:hypothetical protein